MTINQLSIFVENRHGALSQITDILAENKIDIRAMSLAETQSYGVLRLIVDNTELAASALSANGIVFHTTQVIAAAVPDEPGGLARTLRVLSDNEIDIMYMYAFIAVSGNFAAVVMRIGSSVRDKAAGLLAAAGVRILGEGDVSTL